MACEQNTIVVPRSLIDRIMSTHFFWK